jgi:hypothetical protein
MCIFFGDFIYIVLGLYVKLEKLKILKVFHSMNMKILYLFFSLFLYSKLVQRLYYIIISKNLFKDPSRMYVHISGNKYISILLL